MMLSTLEPKLFIIKAPLAQECKYTTSTTFSFAEVQNWHLRRLRLWQLVMKLTCVSVTHLASASNIPRLAAHDLYSGFPAKGQ
jgi:hypothetical protein